jgi:hypothetical protein
VTVQAKWSLMKIRKRALAEVCQRLYRDTGRDMTRSMIVAGAGRSGTTWLTDIVSSQIACRIMFEPFNPHAVAAFSQFPEFQYKRPTDSDPGLHAYAKRILQGDIRDRWIDRDVNRIFSQYRLVKEIRANLFLKWLSNQFPDVRLLLVVRHPCAVVLSRMEANWEAEADLKAFLSQAQLVNDFLGDKMAIIQNAHTNEERHAIVWCILHLVPSRQFQPGQLPVVFYEDLCLQPERAFGVVFGALDQQYHASVFNESDKPSRTTSRKSAVLTGENKVTKWTTKLTRTQIRDILSVVQAFDLDYLYGDSVTPLVDTLC